MLIIKGKTERFIVFKGIAGFSAVRSWSRSADYNRLIIAIVALGFLSSACASKPLSENYRARPLENVTAANSTPVNNRRLAQNPDRICDRISDIKLLPFHSDRGEDATYDAFIDAGEAAVPCLIKKITDTTRVPDPRETLKSPDTTVGDIAYFLLIDITKLDFAAFLPPDVQAQYKDQGVFAYYKYVQRRKNRAKLQSRFNEWYRQQYGKDARALP